MTDRQISEERIARALRAQADEAVRPFDPTEIARLAAAGASSRLPLRWASRFGRRRWPLRWVVVATTALLLLAAIAALVGGSVLRGPTPLGATSLFVEQMVCDPVCDWPTGIRASTVDPRTGQTIASWNLPFKSDSMAGPSIPPAWSPDRRHVLLYDWRNQLVAIVDVPTGTLAMPVGDDPTGITGYTWGPGSDKIARVIGGDADGVSIFDLTLHQLARFELPVHAMIDSPPTWSPDGSTLVVSGCLPCDTSEKGSPPAPHQRQLFLMPVDGSPVRALPVNVDLWLGEPAWSPDGASIAFATTAGIGTIDVGDGHERTVTTDVAADLRWSPDGGLLAFSSPADRGGSGGIVIVDKDGGHRMVLTNGTDSRPLWSPDGSWIVFTRNASDTETPPGDVMIIPVAGGEPRLISTGSTVGW